MPKPKIISISLPEKSLSEIESLQKELGLNGRSETIRKAIDSLKRDNEDISKIKGEVNLILTLVHSGKSTREVSGLTHKHEGLIRSQLHNHLNNHKCVEILTLKGRADLVKLFIKECKSNKKIESCKAIIC